MNNLTIDIEKARNLAVLVYALQAASFLVPLTTIAGVIINYLKRADVAGTQAESHFRWQIRTFWFFLLWGVVGGLLAFVVVGYFVLFANVAWFIYRIAKGWLRLADGKEMYTENS
jgi:uncharacterized membrane protein